MTIDLLSSIIAGTAVAISGAVFFLLLRKQFGKNSERFLNEIQTESTDAFDTAPINKRIVGAQLDFVAGQATKNIPIRIYRDSSTIMGRSRKLTDNVIRNRYVSKRHFQVTEEDGHFILYDLDSSNGTFLNGKQLIEPSLLKDGDKIQIGPLEEGVTLQFRSL